jgi:hypothetical protein
LSIRSAGTEEIFHLSGEDDHCDARREASDDRIRNEFDQRAHARQAEQNEDEAGDDRADHQAFVAELRDDAEDDHDEGAGRSADLHAAAAECGDEEAGDDRGVKPALRRHARGDRERERQRQCHDADNNAREQITQELLASDSFANTNDRFRDEQPTCDCTGQRGVVFPQRE